MGRTTLLLLPPAVLLILACAGRAPSDSAYSGVVVDRIEFDCDSDGVWWWDVFTVGITDGMELTIEESGQGSRKEKHTLSRFQSGGGGAWDNYYMELVVVNSPGGVVDGQTTLFDCSNATVDKLTWTLWLDEGPCASWGDDPGSTGCPVWK